MVRPFRLKRGRHQQRGKQRIERKESGIMMEFTQRPEAEKQLPRLQQKLGEIGRERLQQALDALARVTKDTEPRQSPAELLMGNMVSIGIEVSRDAHWLLVNRPEEQGWAEAFLGRLPELCRCYRKAARPTGTEEERRYRLARLTAVAAGVMIPRLARAGRYLEAIRLADQHRALLVSEACRDVGGAGSDVVKGEANPELRFILLSPVQWSLVACCLEVTTKTNREARALNELVRNLQHIETLNVCVQTSIGGLAVQADPKRWFEMIADGADAARTASDAELVTLLEDFLELADKPVAPAKAMV